jgi:hypothetical protein
VFTTASLGVLYLYETPANISLLSQILLASKIKKCLFYYCKDLDTLFVKKIIK